MSRIQEEPALDACAGLLYHLHTGRLANGNIHNETNDLLLLRLLLADYARRSASLPASIQADLNSRVMGYLAAVSPHYLWAGLGRTMMAAPHASPLTLDVGLITTSQEELRATTLAFEVQKTLPDHVGEPAHVVSLDSNHLPGRLLSVGIFRTEDRQAGSLADLIHHMRRRRIPRLVCLVGAATSAFTNVSRFDVVAPRIVYRIEREEDNSETDLSTAESLTLRDRHLHGLEAYDPEHTGYRGRLQALLKGVPRQYKVGIRPNQLRPVFAVGTCIAVVDASTALEDSKDQLHLTRQPETVCIVDNEAYEFAESLPGETWLIFRGVQGFLADDLKSGASTYLASFIAALFLRDFLENYYVPPGAADL